jgi:proteasome lid subunit RPN8/RPN11
MDILTKKIPENVIIKPQAFIEMILAAVEAYRYECLGLLIGMRGIKSFIIEDAQVLQTAKRSPYHAEPSPEREKRIFKILHNLGLSHFEPIGDFHSHPELGEHKGLPEPSGDDIADMKPGKVYIIIAINNKTKNKKWRFIKRKKILTGTLDEYEFELAAYYCYKENKFKKIDIKCPFVTSLV